MNLSLYLKKTIIYFIRSRYAEVVIKKFKNIYNESKISESNIDPLSVMNRPCHDILEISEIKYKRSLLKGKRLTLVLPFLSQQHIFGGTATALRVFDRLRSDYDQCRIVIVDESELRIRANDYYSAWPIFNDMNEDIATPHIVAVGRHTDTSVFIAEGDKFLATIWYTAYYAFKWIDWQNVAFGSLINNRKITYLIQDYEPGFYSYSARFALAESTYQRSEQTDAIINSKELADYFKGCDYKFNSVFVLQPRLNPVLNTLRNKVDFFEKKKIILIYGRPSTDRNAFSLIVSALELFSKSYSLSNEWTICCVGEQFESFVIGRGLLVKSLGKLSIEEYSEYLMISAIGISLMISPHPSYPPLEMAAHGVRTVTNKFANKNLENISNYIKSLTNLNPETIASYIALEAENFDANKSLGTVNKANIDWNSDFLDERNELHEFRAGA